MIGKINLSLEEFKKLSEKILGEPITEIKSALKQI